MELSSLLISIVVTSWLAYAAGRRFSVVNRSSFRRALEIVLECVGAGVIFLGINICLEVAIVLSVRTFTPSFMSVYAINYFLLIIFSAFQGLTFQILWKVNSQRL